MAARPQFTGMRWSSWLRHTALRNGILTGIYLSSILVSWLVVANRVRELVPYAEVRNLLAGGLLVAVMAIPALRFRQQPGKLFVAGLAAWTLLTITYRIAEMHFTLLGSRMGSLHIFMLGAVSYGFAAVLDWVFLICAGVRHQHLLQSREAAGSAGKQSTH